MAQEQTESSFGSLLRQYREKTFDKQVGAHLSQSNLANKLAQRRGLVFSRNNIGRWENDQSIMPADDRRTLLGLLAILRNYGGLSSPEEANRLLAAGDYRSLDRGEQDVIFGGADLAADSLSSEEQMDLGRSPGFEDAPKNANRDAPPDINPPTIDGVAIPDVPSDEDLLGYRDYVEALSNFIESPKTKMPLTIGIDAAWGGGKTTLMRMLQERLGGNPKKGWRQRALTFIVFLWKTRRFPANLQRFHTVWFNAWTYNKEDALWAALALEIWSQTRQKVGWWKRNGLALALNAKRFDWSRLALDLFKSLMLSSGLAALALIAFAGLSLLLGKDTPRTFDWLQDYVKAFAAAGLIAVIYSLIKDIANLLLSPFSAGIVHYVREPDYVGRIGFIREFQQDFNFVIESVTQKGKWPMAIFIDDLDRCTPDKAVEVIEAINLLLGSEYCVFIIGMDSSALSRSIQAKYRDIQPYFDDADYTSHIGLGRHFLEKIIQIEFHIPRPDRHQIQDFISAQLGRNRPKQSAAPEGKIAESLIQAEQRSGRSLDEARRLVQEEHPELGVAIDNAAQSVKKRAFEELPEVEKAINDMSPFLNYNPRQIKRFINMYRLQALIAFERRILESAISLDKLARWVVLGMRWPEFVERVTREPDVLTRLWPDVSKLTNLRDEQLQKGLERLRSANRYSATMLRALANREFNNLFLSVGAQADGAQNYLHLLNIAR